MPHQNPAAISRLARSMGYYEVELPTMQESKSSRFRHQLMLARTTHMVEGTQLSEGVRPGKILS